MVPAQYRHHAELCLIVGCVLLRIHLRIDYVMVASSSLIPFHSILGSVLLQLKVGFVLVAFDYIPFDHNAELCSVSIAKVASSYFPFYCLVRLH